MARSNGTLHRAPTGVGYRYWESSDFPVQVKIDPRVSPVYVTAVNAAVLSWNDCVGGHVLYVLPPESMLSPDENRIDVIERRLGVDPETGKRMLGLNTPKVRVDGRVMYSLVELDPVVPLRHVFELVVHELGHALGLEHDDTDSMSTMYLFVADGQRIRNNDSTAVRRMLPGETPITINVRNRDPWAGTD